MANTYTQIHIHAIFAVKNRRSLINEEWKERLYQYIIGIIQGHDHKVLAIGGTSDHIHILFGYRPKQSLPDLIKNVKRDSSLWINENHFVKGKFSWQEGYGAFSYSKSHLAKVVDYIANQEKHHQKRTFIEEYKTVLSDSGTKFDERYIFKKIE